MVLLGAGLLAILFGGQKDDGALVFEPVGQPTSGADPWSGSGGSSGSGLATGGDPDVLGTALPPGEDVAALMDPSDVPELVADRPAGPGPTGALCAQISPNSLGSYMQAWLLDQPEGWEVDLSVVDYGTPQEAAHTITARQTEEFRECIRQNPLGASNYSPNSYTVHLIDESHSTAYGKASTLVVMEGTMFGCRHDGRVAVGYRQVEQYSISAKVFGCGAIDLSTLDELLDLTEHRITG